MIKTGEKLPEAKFKTMGADGPQDKTSSDLFKNKRVVLFAVPGAFTSVCQSSHLAKYIQKSNEILSKKIDKIYVTGVNDVFVMDAWEKANNANGKITFLADGSGDFAKSIGLTADMNAFGMGTRSKRYAMIVNDGAVEKLFVEDNPGKVEKSGAEAVLQAL